MTPLAQEIKYKWNGIQLENFLPIKQNKQSEKTLCGIGRGKIPAVLLMRTGSKDYIKNQKKIFNMTNNW